MSEEDKKIFQRLIYYNDKEHLAKRIIELQHNIKDLWAQLQQKENIIKEVREYIEHENFKRTILVGVSTKKYTKDILNKILEILDKGE